MSHDHNAQESNEEKIMASALREALSQKLRVSDVDRMERIIDMHFPDQKGESVKDEGMEEEAGELVLSPSMLAKVMAVRTALDR